jgi:hypothetical protein
MKVVNTPCDECLAFGEGAMRTAQDGFSAVLRLVKNLAAIASAAPFFLAGIAQAGTIGPVNQGDTIEATWSNPTLSGTVIDPVTNALTGYNNSSSAVFGISNAASSSTINWGTYSTTGITNPPGVPDAAGCASIAPTPCQSTVTFIGATLPANTSVPFTVGTFTYTNGTSNSDSLIFGATLTFVDVQTGTTIGSDTVSINTTLNTGTATQNADYLVFSGLTGVSFNEGEGQTATAMGKGFVDGLVLTSLTITGGTGGFIGNDPPLPATVPEPASIALLGAGITCLTLIRRRRNSPHYPS